MDRAKLEALLTGIKSGEISIDSGVEELRHLPYADLGFARVDHHRALRSGFPEVVFATNKTNAQLIGILREIETRDQRLLATRVSADQAQAVQAEIKSICYDPVARLLYSARDTNTEPVGRKIAVVCAGTSDIPVAEEAALTAQLCGSPVERYWDVGVAGLHRILEVRSRLDAAGVIVVVAGMEGALPSVVKGLVRAPVVAVPTSVGYGASFGGLAALLGMLNSCSTGVVVVNIDNGFGAGFSAALMAQV